jgi:pimeloyl-ACP methyl ester carboxylesterase
VVPLLSDRHTLVCPDLRGYGRSSKPMAEDAPAELAAALTEFWS